MNLDLTWHEFFGELRDKLAYWRDKQEELLDLLCECQLQNGYKTCRDSAPSEIHSIDPFTVFGQFLRFKEKPRNKTLDFAQDLASRLGLNPPTKHIFNDVPRNYRVFFWDAEDAVYFEKNVQLLWDLFEATLTYVDIGENSNARKQFVSVYDECVSRDWMRCQLSKGLFWMFPDLFVPLDDKTRHYIKFHTPLSYFNNERISGKGAGERYLAYSESVRQELRTRGIYDHAFSILAASTIRNIPLSRHELGAKRDKYDINKLSQEGCFLSASDLKDILATWTTTKNLILQGPPGTGKTWLAKRLAKVLLFCSPAQEKDQLQAVQFHANTSYEDFVQGFRPSQGGLTLQAGPFLEFIERAKSAPDRKFVFVIEEINRGTPAQIFGELLTLLESDKRAESEALLLSYSDERIYIPTNLFVIGTMNTADRSLAIMDFALRRRFAFETLKPCFNEHWVQWCLKKWDDEQIWTWIKKRIETVNDTIESDPLLGSQFAIGHSFVTPSSEFNSEEEVGDWYKRVVSREILPLVSEYWFDDKAKQEQAEKDLRDG